MTQTIRPYAPADLPALREICLRTAAAGGDATGLYSSDDVMPDLFCEPYLLLEPELASVIETETGMAGYIIGTADTRSFVDRYEQQWMPRLAAKYTHVDPPVTPEEKLLHLGFTPRRMLIEEVDEFPAHLHIDLLPEVQGRGVGRTAHRKAAGAAGRPRHPRPASDDGPREHQRSRLL